MKRILRDGLAGLMALLVSYTTMLAPVHAALTTLADFPIGANGSNNVPANVLLTPSVEFPTAISKAHIENYTTGKVYLGYFDSYKCYAYNSGGGYFVPKSWTSGVTASNGKAVRSGNMMCSGGLWSGNYLNWATMQTIDTFRLVLTGGDRLVDTETTTVVQKAYASTQGSASANFPVKTISSNVAALTPYSTSSVNVSIWGLGRAMQVTAGSNTTTMNVAVQVCVSATDPSLVVPMLEDNCTAYGQNYKPEGLVQQNATKMRFGMYSYLNDSNIKRDGGVLRARMKSVGPERIVPGQANVSNGATEWQAGTGIFVANPDEADAAASGVSNSGVINYLNKFGLSTSYKTYDNVSEMYYGAIRYLRKQGPVTEWQNALNATMKDQFPVITDWDDPIQLKCQKNFTVGIGDVNTHADRNIPTGTNQSSSEPSMPGQVSSDPTPYNQATNALGAFEGLGSGLGATLTGATAASYYIAGIASWAHTNDIRDDLPETQTVDFYWVDVMEGSVYKDKNQYWLAAKYGGFNDLNGSKTPDLESEWAANGNSIVYGGKTYKLPDNYFAASNPQAMADGLKKTFAQIGSKIARNAGVGLSSANVSSTGVEGYIPSYDPRYWIGDLRGTVVIADEQGNISTQTRFSAQTALESQASGSNWNSGRRIAFGWRSGDSLTVSGFRQESMTSAQLAKLDASTPRAKALVSYLRGDRSNEGTAAMGFRKRQALLGSIVNSDPAVVKESSAAYDDGANPGYSAFKSSNASRAPVVIVGSNDGMIHAFNGDTSSSSGGRELWAYVPAALFENADPTTSGLANFANPSYDHRYLVDGPIRVQDVDVGYVSSGGGASSGGDWRTLAVVGLGKGGKSYVGIDATRLAEVTSEATLASKILWEFTDPRMGYTFGKAQIFKTKAYGWVVALPSGYNNADGKGYVFLIDPKTGALRQTLTTDSGSASDPIGLAHIGAYVPDLGDHTADMLYAGDLQGNVWRWDLTGTDSVSARGLLFAKLTNNAGDALPITTEPEIQSQPGTQDRYVFFGTGRYLAESDTILNQRQALYAVRDGRRFTAWQSNTLPAGITFPIVRGNLQQVTDLSNGVVMDARKGGWYYELTQTGSGGTSAGANERVVINPVAFGGQVAYASFTPSSDPCSPAGTARLYILGFPGGRSQLSVPYVSLPQAAVKLTVIGSAQKVSVVATLTGALQSTSSEKDYRCMGDLCQIDMRSVAPNAVLRMNVREVRPD